MVQQLDIDVGVVEAAGCGQGAELSGDAAEQLEALVFGSILGGGPAEGVQAARHVVAGQSVEDGNGVEVGIAQGHGLRIGQTNKSFQEENMIELTRLNHATLVVNCDLIEHIETTPDTVVSMTTGQKITVLESAEEVVRRVIEYRRRIAQ